MRLVLAKNSFLTSLDLLWFVKTFLFSLFLKGARNSASYALVTFLGKDAVVVEYVRSIIEDL